MDRYQPYSSPESQALMVALEREPRFRFFPLPPHFDFRIETLWPRSGPRQPHVVHDRRIGKAGAPSARDATIRARVSAVFDEARAAARGENRRGLRRDGRRRWHA